MWPISVNKRMKNPRTNESQLFIIPHALFRIHYSAYIIPHTQIFKDMYFFPKLQTTQKSIHNSYEKRFNFMIHHAEATLYMKLPNNQRISFFHKSQLFIIPHTHADFQRYVVFFQNSKLLSKTNQSKNVNLRNNTLNPHYNFMKLSSPLLKNSKFLCQPGVFLNFCITLVDSGRNN